jgi:AhpD family alkylhydroperoxidase
LDALIMKHSKFHKRTYRDLARPIQDVYSIVRLYRKTRSYSPRSHIPPLFRERLMLSVTGVNQCRYCAYVHSRNALSQGVPAEQIRELVDERDLRNCPEDELPALLYAQHWAETAGQVDPDARRRMLEVYGEAQTAAIELVLQTIQVANLSGNTWDYLLYRMGFLPQKKAEPDLAPADPK